MDKRVFSRAQGTLEYLVIIAIVIVISLIVAGLSTDIFQGSASKISSSSSVLGNRVGSSSAGISIVEAVSDTNGDVVIGLLNKSGDSFTVSGISSASGAVDNDYDSYVPSGVSQTFSLGTIGDECKCSSGDVKKTCEFIVTLTSAAGIVKTETVSVSVDCVSNAAGAGSVVEPIVFGPLWLKGNDNSASDESVNGYSVTVDSGGNVYVAGYYSGDLNVGGTVLSNVDYDFFVVKYDSSGNVLWVKSSDNSTAVWIYAYKVAVDSSGSVYVMGLHFGDLNVGGIILPGYGGGDFFVVKYDSSGNFLWAKSDDYSVANSYGGAYSGAVDSSDNVYVVGDYGGDLNVGGTVLPNYAGSDFFVVKYDSSGNVLWVKGDDNSASNNSDVVLSVVVDSSGNVYVAGNHDGDLNVGGTVLSNYTDYDFFVVKYDSGGNVLWVKGNDNSASNNYDYANSVAVDSSGSVYVAGTYTGDLNVGGTVLSDYVGYDFFVVKYDSGGNVLWAKGDDNSASNSHDIANSVVVDSSGSVYVSGYYAGDLNVGGTVLSDYAGYDFFVVKYDSSGNVLWVKGNNNSASNNDDVVQSIAVGSSSNVYVSGYYAGDLNVENIVLPNYAGNDFFVVKYGNQ